MSDEDFDKELDKLIAQDDKAINDNEQAMIGDAEKALGEIRDAEKLARDDAENKMKEEEE